MSKRNFFILLFPAIVVYAFNLRLDVMLVDSAQYAEMSWEMLTTGNYLKLHCLGANYLDKPPLIFWTGAISYTVFGVNNFAYKLPSLLFALLAIFSTYRLAKIYYDENMARMAAIVLATSEAMFLITNDVRTDTLLMGAVIFSIWQAAVFFESGRTRNLLAACSGIGIAMLAKGPIGLVTPCAALLPHLILKRKTEKLFDWRMIAGLLIIALLILPFCAPLYQQFGASGLRFYFWIQSFGRITGESEWNNHPDTFFLLHSTAWAFLPWTLFLLAGWIVGLVNLVKRKFDAKADNEYISLSGFTLVLAMLMLSKYQLPHYAFVVYPLAAIIVAKGWMKLARSPKASVPALGLQFLLLPGLIMASAALQYAFKGNDMLSVTCLVILYAVATVSTIAIKTDVHQKIFFASALVFTTFNFLLSAFYFPAIIKYQPQCDFGRYIKHENKSISYVCYDAASDFALVFYAQQMPLAQCWGKGEFEKILNEKKDLLVYASPSALQELDEDHIPFRLIEEREIYPVSLLSFDFLNPSTRSSVCKKAYLLEVKRL